MQRVSDIVFPDSALIVSTYLYDIDRAILVVGPHPLFYQNALIVVASQTSQQHLQRKRGRLPVRFRHGPAAQRFQQLFQRRVAYRTNLI